VTHNYLVLARKYRPKNFAELKGQEFLVTTIINAIKLDRVAHTFLLTGIRGGGKTTTARILAKTLNCSSPIIEEKMVLPCGECKNCIACEGGKHPDIIELDAASRTGVDDVRSIIENASYSPLLGKYKVYIIDEVHMLSTSAFNALLKTLEEPPAHVKFIFATTELRKIPITILSRCQKFELRRLNDEELVSHLKDILAAEKINSDEDALQLIASHAEGSVRDSLSLLDLIIANANNKQITKEQVKNTLGLSDTTQIINLLEMVVKGDSKSSLGLIKEFYYAGKDLLYTLQQMLELVHNLTKIKLQIKSSLLEYSEDDLHKLNELAGKVNIPALTILWQMLLKGMQEMQVARNALMSAEMLMIRFCHLSNIPTPAELITKIQKEELVHINQDAPIRENTSVEPVIEQSKKKIDNFEEVVALFHQQREMLLYEYLVNDIQLVEFLPPKIKIKQSSSVPQNFTKKIAEFLQEYTGDKWSIIVTSDGNAAPTMNAQVENAKAKKIEVASNESPIVQEILQNFPNAKVKDVI
jgi:DNA polymerase III subunit gamma/tau